MRLNLILAASRNGVIGVKGDLPWHLPEDLAHFRKMTKGHPVIMGRKTWDSLPDAFRPLPGRLNFVITRQADWRAEGAMAFTTLEQCLEFCRGFDDVWVIGGAQLYELALPVANRVVLTTVDVEVEGDTFAPTFGSDWVRGEPDSHISATGLRYAFSTLTKN